MNIKYIPLSIIFLLIYGLLNFYIGNIIFKFLVNFISLNKLYFWIIFVILSFSYGISMIFNRILPTSLNNLFYMIGSYWMAFLMYSLLIFPVFNIINITTARFITNYNISITITLIESILVIGLFSLIIIFGHINATSSYINTFNISTNKSSLNKPLNIVMVSDIHLGKIIGNERLVEMVKEINSLTPDLVIIAGDIVDSDIKSFIDNDMAREFANIKSKYGTYATLGNHDLMNKSEKIIVELLDDNGVKVLRDTSILIDNKFYVIGRDDISIKRFNNSRESLDNMVSNLDDSKLKIVIDHTPSSINDSLYADIDFHFSGHTHKGQMAPGNLITKKIFEIDHGYLQKDNLHIFVSSGYGTWGPPLRIGSKSEIMNVIITPSNN